MVSCKIQNLLYKFEIFNSHYFVVYLGQSLKSKRAWIQYLSGAFMAVWLKPLWTLIFIVFILLLFWSWDSLENSLRSWNHGVRKEKLLLFMIQLKYNFANNYELNGFYHSKIRPYLAFAVPKFGIVWNAAIFLSSTDMVHGQSTFDWLW